MTGQGVIVATVFALSLTFQAQLLAGAHPPDEDPAAPWGGPTARGGDLWSALGTACCAPT